MSARSDVIAVRISGSLALFTRPEMKVERVSYDVITPSAARGVLEAILWKPGMRWIVRRIVVLSPVRHLSCRRNEVGSKVQAAIELTQWAGSDDNIRKFEEMFRRRVEKGQHYHQPYLGCREFPAAVTLATGAERPHEDFIGADEDLGLMLHDIEYEREKPNQPRFFHALMRDGVIDVPSFDGGVQ